MERPFINKVLKTYKNTSGNLGIIFNGVKGTGKTITAEIIANESELPVILITAVHEGMNEFISSIPQDLIILIDEYEKIFKIKSRYDELEDEVVKTTDDSLLSLMDGAFKNKYRKLFLLTTNHTWINENLLNRPGRVRYLKNFKDLNREQVNEIIDDCLTEKSFKEDIINFLQPLSLITVDIVKSVISEVNIFKESPTICCKDLNVELKIESYSVVRIPSLTEKATLTVLEENLSSAKVAQFLLASKGRWKGATLRTTYSSFTCTKEPDFENSIFTVYDASSVDKEEFKIKIEKDRRIHSIFL